MNNSLYLSSFIVLSTLSPLPEKEAVGFSLLLVSGEKTALVEKGGMRRCKIDVRIFARFFYVAAA